MTDPRALSPLPTDTWDPILDQVKEDMNGAPINVHKLMAHSPDLLRAWWDFRNYSVNGGSLGPRLAELVILRVSLHLGAWYEWGSHVDRALRVGIAQDTIMKVCDPVVGADFDTVEALVLTSVDELMITGRIQPPTIDALGAHLTTAQMMDMMAIQGMYVLLGAFINTFGLDLDPAVHDRIRDITDPAQFDAASAAFRSAFAKADPL